jgi:hypothetical protein
MSLDELGSLVRAEQVRRLHRLLHEARELVQAHDPTAARAHVLAGLCKILGAPVGGPFWDVDHHPRGRGVCCIFSRTDQTERHSHA